MKNIQKSLFYGLICLLYIPHYLFYFFSKDKAIINQDIRAMNESSGIKFCYSRSLVIHLFNNKYYRNIFVKRISKYGRYILWYTPCDKSFFPVCDQIGGGICLRHPFSTILNAKSIGTNFMCRQCTTIGNKKSGDKDLPIIGDNVTLGANVCIIGDITIGNNVTVGAGSVVVKSIPDNAVVAGNPAKIIRYIN